MSRTPSSVVPEISPRRFRWFLAYTRYYLRRHFHAVRRARPEAGTAEPWAGLARSDGPVVVYANHPSWWDPLVFLVLADRFFPERDHYGPMDAAALERYGVFRKLGFFGVETGTRAGARTFLRTATAILEQPRAMLWITPQGELADPRKPLRLEPGVAALARRVPSCTFLPLALEYPFWTERTPEALARFGAPVTFGEGDDVTERLTEALADTRQALARAAVERRPESFETLLSGDVGVGGVYDLWRRLRAAVTGRRFSAAHDPGAPGAPGASGVGETGS